MIDDTENRTESTKSLPAELPELEVTSGGNLAAGRDFAGYIQLSELRLSPETSDMLHRFDEFCFRAGELTAEAFGLDAEEVKRAQVVREIQETYRELKRLIGDVSASWFVFADSTLISFIKPRKGKRSHNWAKRRTMTRSGKWGRK